MAAPEIPGAGPGRLLRVHGWWVLLVAGVVTAVSFAVTQQITPIYESRSRVVVEAQVYSNTTPVQPDMGTEKQIGQSGVVLSQAAAVLKVDPGELSTNISVALVPDTNMLEFAATHSGPVAAQHMSQAMAEAYVAYRNAPPPTEKNGPRATQTATLVSPAFVPATPKGNPREVGLLAGILAGLALGVATAVLRDRIGGRLRDRIDFQRGAGIPVLVGIPQVRRRDGDDGPAVLNNPEGADSEAYRVLRTRLQGLTDRHRSNVVLVTSPTDKEDLGAVAANLAVTMALSGVDVVLVDAEGLAGLLSGRRMPMDSLRDGVVDRLRVVRDGVAGELDVHAAELFEQRRLRRTFDDLRSMTDLVIIQAEPVLSVADAVALATVADVVLLVAERGRTTRTQAATAYAELATVEGITVRGVWARARRGIVDRVPRGRRRASEPPEPAETPDRQPPTSLSRPGSEPARTLTSVDSDPDPDAPPRIPRTYGAA